MTLATAPRLVTLEGIEGAGKSTVFAALRTALAASGSVTCTREPGGTPLAEQIRALLLARGTESPCDAAELLLMFAARAQHVCNVVRPALERGEWVLSDRFTDASHAYQGGGRGFDREDIALLEARFVGLRPGLTLLLDVPPEVGLARAQGRGAMDRIESEQAAFFDRVRGAYLDLAAAEPDRIRVIDASRPADAVVAEALALLQAHRVSVP